MGTCKLRFSHSSTTWNSILRRVSIPVHPIADRKRMRLLWFEHTVQISNDEHKLSKFKKTNIDFLGEFPSTLAISCFHPKPTNIFEGRFYHQCQSREPEKFPTIETLRTYVNKCSVSLKSAHNITSFLTWIYLIYFPPNVAVKSRPFEFRRRG
jgi:hypothetical protein